MINWTHQPFKKLLIIWELRDFCVVSLILNVTQLVIFCLFVSLIHHRNYVYVFNDGAVEVPDWWHKFCWCLLMGTFVWQAEDTSRVLVYTVPYWQKYKKRCLSVQPSVFLTAGRGDRHRVVCDNYSHNILPQPNGNLIRFIFSCFPTLVWSMECHVCSLSNSKNFSQLFFSPHSAFVYSIPLMKKS